MHIGMAIYLFGVELSFPEALSLIIQRSAVPITASHVERENAMLRLCHCRAAVRCSLILATRLQTRLLVQDCAFSTHGHESRTNNHEIRLAPMLIVISLLG